MKGPVASLEQGLVGGVGGEGEKEGGGTGVLRQQTQVGPTIVKALLARTWLCPGFGWASLEQGRAGGHVNEGGRGGGGGEEATGSLQGDKFQQTSVLTPTEKVLLAGQLAKRQGRAGQGRAGQGSMSQGGAAGVQNGDQAT